MPAQKKLRILFVFNPVSGGQSKAQWETCINAYFKNVEHEYETYHTRGDHDKSSIKHYIDTWRPDRVFAVGGDGTLKMVAEILEGMDIPVGVLPAGSANGMARDLGVPFDPEACMDMVINGEVRKIDIIKVNESDSCLHLSDIGMNAQLVKYFEERGLRGKIGYARGIFKVLWKRRLLQVTIKDGDHVWEREAFMVVLANARMYGTGAMINPQGDFYDGRFEVIIVRRLSPLTLLKMFFKRKSINTNKLEIISVKSVEITVKTRAYFQVDGEYKGKMKVIKARAVQDGLAMVLPVES